jgi:hypothetical protein
MLPLVVFLAAVSLTTSQPTWSTNDQLQQAACFDNARRFEIIEQLIRNDVISAINNNCQQTIKYNY